MVTHVQYARISKLAFFFQELQKGRTWTQAQGKLWSKDRGQCWGYKYSAKSVSHAAGDYTEPYSILKPNMLLFPQNISSLLHKWSVSEEADSSKVNNFQPLKDGNSYFKRHKEEKIKIDNYFFLKYDKGINIYILQVKAGNCHMSSG